MKRREAPEEEGAPETPAWIVSYSDMVTLLLAFFVLLQVFAKEQDPELLQKGRGGFRRSIQQYGLPQWLFGKDTFSVADYKKKIHPTEEDNKTPKQRIIDAEDRRIRQVFQDLKQQIDTETKENISDPVNVVDIPVRFKRSQASLDAAARKALSDLVVNIKQNYTEEQVKIYLVGMAPDESPGEGRWILSARRARAAQEFMKRAFSDDTTTGDWNMISWGSGAGRLYDSSSRGSDNRTFIRIAIHQGH